MIPSKKSVIVILSGWQPRVPAAKDCDTLADVHPEKITPIHTQAGI